MGEAKKRRHCPALGRDISAGDCGENRLSRHACPESCEHNPFGVSAYSRLLEIEDRLDLITVKRLATENDAARRAILAAGREDRMLRMNSVSIWQIFFRLDAAGRTFAERWEQSGFAGLRNDERVLFRGKMKMRVAVIEVHRVLDAERFEVVNLLRPDDPPFIMVDRSLAARAPRFYTALSWIYPLPHFWRLSGTAVDFADLPGTGRSILDAFVAHLGGPADEAARERWLAENFVRMTEALIATGIERRRLMFAAIDGTWGAATYVLQVPLARAAGRLERESAVVAEPASESEREQGFSGAFVWLDEASTAKTGQRSGKPRGTILGRVLVGAKEWRVEAMGRERLQNLRTRFEARMGKAVTFSRERIDDLAARLDPGEPTPNPELVPPQLLEQANTLILSSSRVPQPPPDVSVADQAAWLQHEFLRSWPEEAVPALDGRTPREAASDPAMRQRLIELVKKQVRRIDEENLRTGRNDDASELIRSLGLAEIDFPPPPPRAALREIHDEEFDSIGDESSDALPDEHGPANADERPLPPRLSGPPLTFEAALKRTQAALGQFDRAADALVELHLSGTDIVGDVAAMTEDMFEPGGFEAVVPSLLQAWFALVPCGVRAPELSLDMIADEIDALNAKLAEGGSAAVNTMKQLSETGRQPGLLTVLIAQYLSGMDRMPKSQRPSAESRIAAMVVLRVVLDELDRALRR
jgi:hypothetical protein